MQYNSPSCFTYCLELEIFLSAYLEIYSMYLVYLVKLFKGGYFLVEGLGTFHVTLIYPFFIHSRFSEGSISLLLRFLVGEGARLWAKSKGIVLAATIKEVNEVAFTCNAILEFF